VEKMNVRHYNDVVAKGYFRKVYPLLANKVKKCTGLNKGYAIDLGGGPGMFGIALAKITDMRVTVVDPNPECIEAAVENIVENQLIDRMNTSLGCAENIPFPQDSVDLVISRGSIPFWDDPQKGISEIFRVIRPGGWAYFGCGMGSKELSIEIAEARRRDDPEWTGENQKEYMRRIPPEKLAEMLADLDIEAAIEASPAGIWVVFQKPYS
jgi:ubiquinone/menaquinone biosynthesis C-methylase UbiE